MKNKNRKQNDSLHDEIFLCPVCGNELYKSDRPQIKCTWCNSWIKPEGKTNGQKSEICRRRK